MSSIFDFADSEKPKEPYQTAFTLHDNELLIREVPNEISFSQVLNDIPNNAAPPIFIRDFWDIKMQCFSENENKIDCFGSFDLIPNVYEGGFKTWECAIDLAKVLQQSICCENVESMLDTCCSIDIAANKIEHFFKNLEKKEMVVFFEAGCGSALPSLVLFCQAAKLANPSRRVKFILQDYNSEVVKMSTLPNFLLCWKLNNLKIDEREALIKQGTLGINSEMRKEFMHYLRHHKIELLFISGSWRSLSESNIFHNSPDLILGSELVYSPISTIHLSNLLKKILKENSMALISAKTHYFGTNGSINQFENIMKELGISHHRIFQSSNGVARTIVSCLKSVQLH